MPARNYSSTAKDTTLSAAATDVATSITVVATTGFPAAPFVLALDAGVDAQELVLVTAVDGTTLTVTRGYDSTTAQAHASGAAVSHSHAGIDFREVATLAGTETLTNKTITGSDGAATLGTDMTGGATARLRGGGLVHVTADITVPAGGAAADAILATLPVGFRPVATFHDSLYNVSTGAYVAIRFAATGLVQNVTALAASNRVLGTTTFPNA